MSPIGIIHAEYEMASGYVFAKIITGDIVLINCDQAEKVTRYTPLSSLH